MSAGSGPAEASGLAPFSQRLPRSRLSLAAQKQKIQGPQTIGHLERVKQAKKKKEEERRTPLPSWEFIAGQRRGAYGRLSIRGIALTFSDREMETREKQSREVPAHLSRCQETGADGCVPRCSPQQPMHGVNALTPCSCIHPENPVSFWLCLGLRCQHTPAPGRVSPCLVPWLPGVTPRMM